MKDDTARRDEDPKLRLDRRIRRDFRASLLSDTKWRKLFTTLDELGVLWLCRIKFIDVDEPERMQRPTGVDLSVPHAYVDLYKGPFALRLVEWIEFPRTVVEWPPRYPDAPLTTATQEVELAERALREIGEFPMELTGDGLRVTGHVR